MNTKKIDNILDQLILQDETEARQKGINPAEIQRYKNNELKVHAKIRIVEEYTKFEVHLIPFLNPEKADDLPKDLPSS